ncbi:MAG TPA: zinc-dependent metalloprotease family protein [Pyrinomonadaceae bacterium]|nr:zinc-dependent metalloprotease family protein [Pyrinomonadaceae bacterium]
MKSRRLFLVMLVAALVGLGLTARAPASSGQTVGGELWSLIEEDSITGAGRRLIIPSAYRTARLNQSALSQLLAQAPLEFTPAARASQVILSLPMPDGSFSRFRVEESPVMSPGLAARFPAVRTYRGRGVDDPTATARFDRTPAGFHAIVFSPAGTVLVDPYAEGDTLNYITYFKRDAPKEGRFQCHFSELNPEFNPDAAGPLSAPRPSAAAAGEVGTDAVSANGAVLRTYRLALAATAEYVNVFRQPSDTDQQAKERALVQMVIVMNRVNGVYERDVAIRMLLIDRELDIIYTNPLTDPYTNDAGATMLTENQSNLDAVIGAPNYDIGHVFSTGGGGVATLRVPCRNGSKARGVTGLPNPVGDPFAIDYVAHEMGHQWGGNHTFNGVAESCGTPGQRTQAAAMEPGSGSTIQAYAGICSSQDLQKNSDDYFHVKSLEEIIAYSTTSNGNACDVETPLGNAAPSVEAGQNYTIPKDTPFALTAQAADPDGDALTYAWEEYDTSVLPSPPDSDLDGQPRPILRSYRPVASPTRTFPSLKYILNNANQPPMFYECGITIRGQSFPCLTGEVLPSANRTMNFQVTARDNRGGVHSDTAQVTVVRNSGVTVFGPFAVTQPNTSANWPGRAARTVTWDVANTNLAPVSAANVKITLSVDGGQTFPYVLAESTPNDGSEAVTVPNVGTDAARVRVEAVGNIFFDISDADFQITADPCLVNHALGATATASSVYPNWDFNPMSAIDGDRTGVNWGSGGGWNDGTRATYPDWLEVSFGGARAVNQVRVYTLQDGYAGGAEPTAATTASENGIIDFDIQAWDGTSWVTVPGGEIRGNALALRAVIFPEVTTTKVRVLVLNSRLNYSRIVEVEAIGCGN